MPKNIKTVSTLEFYNYGENNKMTPSIGSSYKVKVSDKEGNIITIEKDDALYACVRLSFDSNTGILQLLDAAHDNSVLAEIEMPNADYIYNCRFDEELNSILFDVKSLYGNETSTIELDVESLVELYEAGQGIEIGEKNEETGRKPISIKLAEGESILHLSDDGLGIDEKVITDDELEAAISGKADTDYVNELLSGITGDVSTIVDRIEAIEDILGTDIDDPNIDERIDSKADLDEFNDLEEEVGEIETNVNTLSGTVQALDEELEEEKGRALSAETELSEKIDAEKERAQNEENVLNEKIEEETNERKSNAVASVDYLSDTHTINFFNAKNEIIDSIDATDFIKDGMVDSVELVEISGDTYLRVTWNTDAGKEVTDINIGDIFDADNYYNKSDVDEKISALQNVDTDIWAAINGEITRAMGVETDLWRGINGEGQRAQDVETQLWGAIGNEASTRESEDTSIRTALNSLVGDLQVSIQTEIANREAADEAIRGLIVPEADIDSKIAVETTRAEGAEAALQTAIENEATARENADLIIGSKYDELADKITGFDTLVQDETDARISADTALENAIAEINNSYASKDYVDGKTADTYNAAVSSAITNSNAYTDTQVDTVETDLKHYCDSGHTELQEAINANATRINAITNDDGNGTLDILHKEFHEFVESVNAALNSLDERVTALEQRL